MENLITNKIGEIKFIYVFNFSLLISWSKTVLKRGSAKVAVR